jgi:hypothetical protein
MDATVEASLKRLKRNKELWDDICDANKNNDEMEERALYRMAFKTKKVYNRESYRESFWYKLNSTDLTDLNSRDGKFFRNRFTVPYQIFTELLLRAQEWFPQKKYDVCGRETTPIFLKLLGTLRMLGKGCSWDLLYELSGVSAEVHRKWTHSFLDKFSKDMYPIYMSMAQGIPKN